ncbi:MAG: hypothetical protein HOW73_07400 [Polyangiaceae bacterium]|nr:hypothetical protein [Polyangiaceae bacterium]
MDVEYFPKIATAGFVALVGLVVALPQMRDPRVVSALEAAYQTSAEPERADGTHPSEGRSSPSPDGSASPEDDKPAGFRAAGGSSVSDAAIDKATTVAELEALATRDPDNAKLLAKLARVQAATPAGLGNALANVKRALAASGKIADDKDLQQIVVRGASGQPAVQDTAFELMTAQMGTVGPDLLYELTIAKSVSKTVKDRALAATKDEAVLKLASPALRIAVQLRDAAPCDRKALFDEAARVGDRRSLNSLTPLQARRGCGVFFAPKDCHPCLGDRADLNKAIEAINGR